MQRYKQHLLDLYGVKDQNGYERTGSFMSASGCIQETEKLHQLPIQASTFGKYVGYHTPYRTYHCRKLVQVHKLRLKGCYGAARHYLRVAAYQRFMHIKRLP